MSVATARSATASRPAKTAAPLATRLATAFAGDRPLTRDEFDLARLVVRRWEVACNVVAKLCGSADATDEYKAARERHAAFQGDDPAYKAARRVDRDLLSVADLASYAGFAAHTVAEPRSVDHAVWGMLHHAELDVIRLVEAFAGPDGSAPGDRATLTRATLTIDGRTFTVSYLDGGSGPIDPVPRLTVKEAGQRVPGPSLN